jgi:hypothetical protein
MARESELFAAHGSVSKVLQQDAGHSSYWGVLEISAEADVLIH